MYIYYDSKTGNVERFINKIKVERPDWFFVKISEEMKIENDGHLITFTTKFGEVPERTKIFMENENNKNHIRTVSSSGNMNWGVLFALAANKISEKYKIPILMKFELSGTHNQVEKLINYIENN